MIAIAVQTTISLILCFAIGFITAWTIRGMRERRHFDDFFEGWRRRYDQLEHDCDSYMARIASLQKDLSSANAQLVNQRESPAPQESGATPSKPSDTWNI